MLLLKPKLAAAELHHITRRERLHLDADAVDERTVCGVVVVHHELAVFVAQAGMGARYGAVSQNHDVAPLLASQCHIRAGKRKYLPRCRALKTDQATGGRRRSIDGSLRVTGYAAIGSIPDGILHRLTVEIGVNPPSAGKGAFALPEP